MRNVFSKEKLVGRGILAETVVHRGASIHEGLCNDGQARVYGCSLVYVKYEIWVFYKVNPKPQRKTVTIKQIFN